MRIKPSFVAWSSFGILTLGALSSWGEDGKKGQNSKGAVQASEAPASVLDSSSSVGVPIAPPASEKATQSKRSKAVKKTKKIRQRIRKRVKRKGQKRQRWPVRRPKQLQGTLPKIGPAPFVEGERMLFKIRMFGADAGEVILAVGQPTMHKGKRAIPLAGFMRSSDFLNKFYPVSNRMVVLADAETMLPIHTDFYVRENGKVIDYNTQFDHRTRFLKSTRVKKKKTLRRNFTTVGDIHEPLGSIYAVRRMDLKVGDIFERYIWDGRKERLTTLKVVGTEQVTTDAGVFDCLKITISTRISGGFIKRKNLDLPTRKGTIWIAQDRWRTPVKMIAPTKLGDAEAVLVRRYVENDEQIDDEE